MVRLVSSWTAAVRAFLEREYAHIENFSVSPSAADGKVDARAASV
jgi:hypothetical protein